MSRPTRRASEPRAADTSTGPRAGIHWVPVVLAVGAAVPVVVFAWLVVATGAWALDWFWLAFLVWTGIALAPTVVLLVLRRRA